MSLSLHLPWASHTPPSNNPPILACETSFSLTSSPVKNTQYNPFMTTNQDPTGPRHLEAPLSPEYTLPGRKTTPRIRTTESLPGNLSVLNYVRSTMATDVPVFP